MIQFLLSLIGLGNPLARIQSLSDSATLKFRKTLLKLKSTEQKIVDHHKVQDDLIAEANKVKKTLSDISANNQKFIAKLEEFIG